MAETASINFLKAGHDNLAEFVLRRVQENAHHRENEGINHRIATNVRMRKGLWQDGLLDYLGQDADYFNIVGQKCSDLIAAFTDMHQHTWTKPWTLEPTPLPSPPLSVYRTVAERMYQDLEQIGLENTQESDLIALAKGYKDQAIKYVRQESKTGAARMEQLIFDQMQEGGWPQLYKQLLHDIGTYPTVFTRGPVPTKEHRLKWVDDRLADVEEVIPLVGRLDPNRCYPSPDAITPTQSTNFCYIDILSLDQLRMAKTMPSFNEQAIDDVLESVDKHETSLWWKWTTQGSVVITDLSMTKDWADSHFGDAWSQSDKVPVVQYYGGALGKQLKAQNIGSYGKFGKLDDNQWYETELWVIGNAVVRAIVKPVGPNDRPIQAVSYRPDPNSIWGESVADLLFDLQMQVLKMLAELGENMKYSARPITEVNVSRFSEDDIPESIFPGATVYTNADPLYQNQRAVNFTNIPNNMAGILQTFDYFKEQAGEISGIPSQLTGDSSPSVNRVGSVFNATNAAALKKIRQVDFQITEYIVQPIVRNLYKYNLRFSKDETIKYDAQVVIKGSAALLRMETMTQQAGLVLQTVTAAMQQPGPQGTPLIGPELFYITMRKYLEGMGIEPGAFIPDPEKDAALASLTGEQVQPQALPQLAPQNPAGDGRFIDIASGQIPAQPI